MVDGPHKSDGRPVASNSRRRLVTGAESSGRGQGNGPSWGKLRLSVGCEGGRRRGGGGGGCGGASSMRWLASDGQRARLTSSVGESRATNRGGET